MVLHWRECGTSPQQMVPSVFRPGPLLDGAHTSAHAASQRMRHSPSSVRLLRWTLIIRICGPPSAQPFFHVCPASRGPWHGVRLHRARHAWHPCCLALCFMGSLLNAAPLAGSRGGGTCHGPAARPVVLLPVPMRHVSLISPALKLFHLHWYPSGRSGLQFPVGSSPLVSGRFLATGVRLLPLGLSSACPSR